MNTARDCLLYARFSSDKQNPKSCDDQLREAQRYAATQGWRIRGQFHDDAITGERGRSGRDGWDQLLSFVEAGGLAAGSVVLTWDVNRWSREWADGMIEALQLHKLGVSLADTQFGVYEQNGLTGKVMLALKMATAAEFLTELRRGVIRGQKAKRAEGYWCGAPPYGYRIQREPGGAVLVADPIEAPAVIWIFQQMAAGTLLPRIAADLRRREVLTRRGGPWNPATLLRIGRSPVYLGVIALYPGREHRRTVAGEVKPPVEAVTMPGRHQPLVSCELWDAANARIASKVIRPFVPGRPRPLTGLVACEICGRSMRVTGGPEPYRYYKCGEYGGWGYQCVNKRIVRIDRLEAAIRTLSLTLAGDAAAIHTAAARAVEVEWRQAAASAAARGPLQAAVTACEHKQERLLAALYEGNAPALVNERLRQVQDELAAARAALDAAGTAVEPLSVDDLVVDIRTALETWQDDFAWISRLQGRLVVPADPAAPVILEVLGQRHVLAV